MEKREGEEGPKKKKKTLKKVKLRVRGEVRNENVWVWVRDLIRARGQEPEGSA